MDFVWGDTESMTVPCYSLVMSYAPLIFPHNSGPLEWARCNCALKCSAAARPCASLYRVPPDTANRHRHTSKAKYRRRIPYLARYLEIFKKPNFQVVKCKPTFIWKILSQLETEGSGLATIFGLPPTPQPMVQYHESTMFWRNFPPYHLLKCLLLLCHALFVEKDQARY